MNDTRTLARRLMQDMYRMARCRHAIFKDILSEQGITLQQFHLMLHVKMGERVKISDLSEFMLVSVPTASRMVNTLSDRGLVAKKRLGDNKRSIYLELTPEGERTVNRLRKRQLDTLARVLEKIPRDHLEAFLEVTEKIADQMVSGLSRKKE